jgi:hypothetical protein
VAATVEGTFRIIDLASGPMRRMQQQAERTDRAIERLGQRMDRLYSPRNIRQMDQNLRAMSNLRREVEQMDASYQRLDRTSTQVSRTYGRMDRDNTRLARSFRGTEREGNRLVTMLGRLGAASIGVRAAMMAIVAPAVVVGINALVKAIGALSAGAIALVPQLVGAGGAIASMVPQLGRLGAAAAALPATFLGLGTAMGVVKLATADLQEAYKGNEQALKRLTPQARTFLDTLKSYQPALNALRGTAQRGLFGGLTTALGTFRTALPYVNALLGDMSRRLGQLAEAGARRFAQRGFLQDFFALGQQGGRIVSTLGRSLFRLVNALRQVAVAAIPFTEWLRRTAEAWSIWIERTAIAARNTGRLTAYFNRARASLTIFAHIARDVFLALNNIVRIASRTGEGLWRGLERATARFRAFTESFEGQARIQVWFERTRTGLSNMISILGSFWRIVTGIGRAAGALGDDLWASFRRTAEGWANLVNSFGGQVALRRWFAQNREAIYELMGLVRDLAQAIYGLSDQRGFPQMIRMLRRGVIAAGELLEKMNEAFGPAVIDAIEQLGILLGNIAGASGPLTLIVKGFATFLRIINRLIDAIPGLGGIITAAITIYGINWAITKVRTLAASWGLVASQAGVAAAAQGRAAMAGAGGGLLGRGGRAGPAVGPMAPPLLVAGGGGWRGQLAAARAARGGGPRAMLAAATAGTRLAAAGGVAGAGRAALGAAGRFIWPVAALGGAFGAITAPREGNIGYQALQMGGGAVSGATFGLVPRIRTGTEQQQERIRRMMEGYTRPTGRAGFLPAGGLAGMAARRFGFVGEERVTGVQERIEALGGAQPRGPRQARAQIAVYQQALRRLRGESGAAAAEARRGLRQEIAVRRDAIRAIADQRKATERLREEQRVTRAQNRARGLLRDLGARFDVVAGARGQTAAFEDLNERVRANLLKMRPAGRKMFVERLLGWATKNAPREEAQKLKQTIVNEWEKTGKRVEIVNGRVLTNSRKNWNAIRKAMSGEAEQARQEVSKKFTALQQIAAGQLRALGYTPAQANQLVRSMERGAAGPRGGPRATTAGQAAMRGRTGRGPMEMGYAQGGRVPGQGSRDTVQIAPGNMAAPGELVVNRHTEAQVNQFLGSFGHTLGGLVAKETRPHFMAVGGRVSAGIESVSKAVRSRFPGLSVTSTTGGQHAAGSYHYKGMAHDIGGPPGVMNAASEWIKASGLFKRLIEGIHNPNLSVKNGQMVSPGFWGGSTWAGHANHIHLAAGGGGALGPLAAVGAAAMMGAGTGGGGPLLGALNAPPSALTGIPGAMSNQAGTRLAAAMRRRINRRIRAMGGGAGTAVAAAGGGGGGNAANQALGRRMMLAMGWGATEWPALKTLWSGESGWRTTADNPSSDAYGIPQALPGSKMASAGPDWKTNPATQIRWGLNYIRGRYGSPTAALAAWQKRSPHWYAQGGRFTARSPTLIGVGERGAERVSIEPARGRGSAASLGPFHFTIHNNRPGDVRRQVEEEVTQAMRSLARKVERMPVVGDSGVMN